MSRKILIIGGGVAGLSAGVYARMNGFDTEIFEMSAIPGGLCTAWKRKGYTFDGCIHWLTGCNTGSSYYPLWEEIGLIQGKQFHYFNYVSRYTAENGKEITIHSDPDILEKDLVALAPEDTTAIRKIMKDIRKLHKHEVPADISMKSLPSLIPVLRFFYKYRCSCTEFAKRFKNPELKKMVEEIFNWHDMSISFTLWSIAQMGSRTGGYPIGGSIPLMESVEKKFIRLGGIIHYRTTVKKILTENGKATGVLLADGTTHHGDIIISAADGHATIFDWLDGKYGGERIRKVYEKLTPFPSVVFVNFGIDADYSSEPYHFSYLLRTPITISDKKITRLEVKNHSYDPTLYPKGKSIFSILFEGNWEYWKDMQHDSDSYQSLKKKIEEDVTGALEEKFPQIRSQIEVTDVATPLTYVRYTGNWKGSYEGWLFTKKSIMVRIPSTLKGLDNFYMVGQWTSPGGGLPSGLITARSMIKKICKKEKVKFTTNRD